MRTQILTRTHPLAGKSSRRARARRALGELPIRAKDLVAPDAARRGVMPRASDRLSRLERRVVYLPL